LLPIFLVCKDLLRGDVGDGVDDSVSINIDALPFAVAVNVGGAVRDTGTVCADAGAQPFRPFFGLVVHLDVREGVGEAMETLHPVAKLPEVLLGAIVAIEKRDSRSYMQCSSD
jgi:hypothetical protein